MKSSEINFISLLAFYLIIGLMKAAKKFEKNSHFELLELVSLWGVKTHFGKLPVEIMHFHPCFIFILTNTYYELALDPIKKKTRYFKMTIWTSVLWNIFMWVAKQWPKMVKKWSFKSHNFQDFFLFQNGKKM